MELTKEWLDEFINSIPNARFKIEIMKPNGEITKAFETNELGVRMLQVQCAKNQFNALFRVIDVIADQGALILHNGTLNTTLDSMSLCIDQKFDLLQITDEKDLFRILGK